MGEQWLVGFPDWKNQEEWNVFGSPSGSHSKPIAALRRNQNRGAQIFGLTPLEMGNKEYLIAIELVKNQSCPGSFEQRKFHRQ